MSLEPYYIDDSCVIYHADCRELLSRWLVDGDGSWSFDDVSTVIADPPYGETSLSWDNWPEDWPDYVPGRSLWCFGSMRMFIERRNQFAGWNFAQDIVWEKQNGSGFQADRFKRVHEHVTHWYRGPWDEVYKNPLREPRQGPYRGRLHARSARTEHMNTNGAHVWVDDGTRMVRSVLRVQSMHQRAEHPTQKPTGIVSPLIEFSCPPGGLVLDPFMGSGTTLRAAKDLGRRAVGIEIDERYCEVAANRLAQEVLPL